MKCSALRVKQLNPFVQKDQTFLREEDWLPKQREGVRGPRVYEPLQSRRQRGKKKKKKTPPAKKDTQIEGRRNHGLGGRVGGEKKEPLSQPSKRDPGGDTISEMCEIRISLVSRHKKKKKSKNVREGGKKKQKKEERDPSNPLRKTKRVRGTPVIPEKKEEKTADRGGNSMP